MRTRSVRGHTHWKIESNEHPLHDEDEQNFKVEHRHAGFWGNVCQLHGRMWVVNAGLNSPHYFNRGRRNGPSCAGDWDSGMEFKCHELNRKLNNQTLKESKQVKDNDNIATWSEQDKRNMKNLTRICLIKTGVNKSIYLWQCDHMAFHVTCNRKFINPLVKCGYT